MNERECPLCQDRRGSRWSEALIKGTKTILEAQQAFGLTREEVEEHLYKHSPDWSTTPKAAIEVQDREFYIKRLAQMGNDLNSLLEDVMDFGGTDPMTIKNVTTLTREIRETLRLLGEVTKVLKDEEAAEAMLAMEDMKRHCMNFSTIVVTLACPECREKIVTALQEQKLMMVK